MSRVERTDITYAVKVQDAGASATFAKIGASMNGMTAQLKGAFGQQSAFGQIGNVLKGAGIAAGVTILVDQLGKAAEATDVLIGKFDRGEISGGELAAGIARSIPIIDRVVGGIESMALAALGYRRELEKSNLEMAKLDAKAKEINSAQAERRKLLGDTSKTVGGERAKMFGGDAAGIRFEAKSQFDENMAKVAELRKRAALSTTGGQSKEEIDQIERNYQNIYAMARVKAEDADQVERQKAFDAARKNAEDFAKRTADAVEEVRKQSEAINKRRELERGFAEEDRITGLESRKAELEKTIGAKSTRARSGATAAVVTDVGRAAVLAGMERRSADPGVMVLKQSKTELEKINATLKTISEDAKRRDRSNALAETSVF